MANVNNWGIISSVSYWGNGAINSIFWGDVYKGYPLGQAYSLRVTLDAGVVESIYCLMEDIQDL